MIYKPYPHNEPGEIRGTIESPAGRVLASIDASGRLWWWTKNLFMKDAIEVSKDTDELIEAYLNKPSNW